jgi:hypothetical protein
LRKVAYRRDPVHSADTWDEKVSGT